MQDRTDVVIIGAGHNGLVCAYYLAARGLKVTVVEARSVVGGAAVTEEFHPGFRNSTASYTADAAGGRLVRLGVNRWRWTAPEQKGLYPLWVRDSASGETVTLNAFVLVPMPSAATISGFMVGRYESLYRKIFDSRRLPVVPVPDAVRTAVPAINAEWGVSHG